MATSCPPLGSRTAEPNPKPAAAALSCDACGHAIEGEPGGHGLYVWTRGSEVRYEEPPLCSGCAQAIGLAALASWQLEEDED